MKAQREGNWALYGEEIKRLGEVLARAVEALDDCTNQIACSPWF